MTAQPSWQRYRPGAFYSLGCTNGMNVLTLGPAGTYSHRAAQAIADGGETVFTEAVAGIVEAVAGGSHDRGVVPVENSIDGSVTEALDAFADYDVAVTREIVTPIRHALLGQRERFDTVASHAQALAQCRSYLEEQYPGVDRQTVASTARGVEHAQNEPTVAAIAHPGNATGDLSLIAKDIQDRSSNATRFLVIGPTSAGTKAGSKTSFIVYPEVNYPGLLLELLEPFAEHDINLTRVESRPSGERLGDYVFHIDIAAGLYEERTSAALEVVESVADEGWVRRLGSYDTETVL
jgi:prephenate dehydratase (EC 4.2.1.51)